SRSRGRRTRDPCGSRSGATARAGAARCARWWRRPGRGRGPARGPRPRSAPSPPGRPRLAPPAPGPRARGRPARPARAPPPSPSARRARELDVAHVPQPGRRRRAPSKADPGLPDRHALPVVREDEVALVSPPDVPATAVDQLKLEVVRAALAPELEGEGVVLRKRDGERLADDDEPAAGVQLEADPHRVPGVALLRGDPDVRALGRARRPAGAVLEVVQRRDVGARCAPREKKHAQEQEEERPHSFTPPAMSPATYQRCSATKIAITGSTVSTAPAIISSVSWTCSPARFASATGSV